MFSQDVTESDYFLDLPVSAQALYLHLGVSADDDGFLSATRRIATYCGCNQSDIDALVDAGYLISFDTGVYCIRHWWASNHIQKDRYHETTYLTEKSMLSLDKAGLYQWTQVVSKMDTEVSIGKYSIGESSKDQESQGEKRECEERGVVEGGTVTAQTPPTRTSEAEFNTLRNRAMASLENYQRLNP
jgi:hypothetical protein